MKTRFMLLSLALALLCAGCQKTDNSTPITLPADPFEAYPFVKHVSVSDFDGDNSVVLKIGAPSQEALDEYRPADYLLIPEYELPHSQTSSGNAAPTTSANHAQPNGVLIKVVVENLQDEVQTFRIQPRSMEIEGTGKNDSAPISFEIYDQYMAAWCLSGSFYAYYFVDDTYRYAIFMTPGQASYGLDYTLPYTQRIDLYLYTQPARIQIYEKGERMEYDL